MRSFWRRLVGLQKPRKTHHGSRGAIWGRLYAASSLRLRTARMADRAKGTLWREIGWPYGKNVYGENVNVRPAYNRIRNVHPAYMRRVELNTIRVDAGK